MAYDVKANSSILLSGRDRAPARSFYKAIGFTDEDLQKPIVGIANTWTETMPCNFNLRQLAVRIKEGVRAAGGTPMEFNTVAISDGITMGTEGMKASLISREVIADSIELVARGVLTNGFVHILDRQIAVAESAGHDRAAVYQQAWHIHPQQGHCARGNGLVAGDQRDHGVEEIAARH